MLCDHLDYNEALDSVCLLVVNGLLQECEWYLAVNGNSVSLR